MNSSTTGLIVNGLTYAYRRDPAAVADVSFSLSGGVVALIGDNGAGKSTLLSILAGARRPDRGSVSVGGADLYGRSRAEALPRLALMPQSARFPAQMTPREVVSFIAWMRGVPRREVDHRVAVALDQVNLTDQGGMRLSSLSGGMQRRVALAQALVGQPQVLLLDEPSTGLDPRQRRAMLEVVQRIAVDGSQSTVVFSSHVMEDVVDVADRVLVLNSGRVVHDGGLDELAERAPATVAPQRRLEQAYLDLTDPSRTA